MSGREVIDLSLSTDDETSLPKPAPAPAKVGSRVQLKAPSGFVNLSDDFDGDVAGARPPATKRRRLSPLPSAASRKKAPVQHSRANGFIPAAASSRPPTKRTEDPIVFSSSSPHHAHSLSSPPPARPIGPNAQFSTRTEALLAEISGNSRPARKQPVTTAFAKRPSRDTTSTTALRGETTNAAQAHRAMAKEQKAQERRRAVALAEVNRAGRDKKLSTTEMLVDLPASIAGSAVETQARELLTQLGAECTSHESVVPGVVKWRRKVRARFDDEMGHWEPVEEETIEDEESFVLCLLGAVDFVHMVGAESGEHSLEAHAASIKAAFPSHRTMYLIEGLEAHMRKNRNRRNRLFVAAARAGGGEGTADGQTAAGGNGTRKKKANGDMLVDEDAVEDALLRLQVDHGCLIHHTTAAAETAQWIGHFTQHVSTVPYRTRRNGPAEASFCMDVGQIKTGDDKDDTYVRMLQEMVRVTLPVACGIASRYSTVRSLVRAMRAKGPLLLEDVKKSSNRNGAFTDARIGPALSKRVYKVFMGTDPASMDV